MRLILCSFSFVLCLSFFYFGDWNSDNFKTEMVRVNKMVLCMRDGQFPCRWVGNYGSELGTPIFNYTAPLPYYIGSVIYLLNNNFSATTKVLYLSPLLLSMVYLLFFLRMKVSFARFALGILLSGGIYWYIVSSLGVDLRLLWSSVSLGVLIICFWNLSKRLTINNALFLAMVSAVFLLSSQSSVFVYVGIVGVGVVYAWFMKQVRLIILFCFGSVLALGVSAFYVAPMIIEGDLVRQNALNGDFLPISVRSVPDKEPVPEIVILVGEAEIFGYEKQSASFRFGIENNDHAIVRLAIPYFPKWVIKSNGRQIQNYYDNNSLGLMTLIFGEGRFIVEGKLEDTPVREIANMVSVASIVVVLFLLFSEMGGIRSGLRYYLKALHT